MRRRSFIRLLGAAAAWPIGVGAQQPASMRRVGALIGLQESDPEGQRWLRRFIQGLRDLGWRNGVNVQIELRWAAEVEDMRTASQQIVNLKPDAIYVATGLATAEVLRRTDSIPVVFTMVNDPVAYGFVKSLAQPGGNATGFTNITSTLAENWLKLLKDLAPTLTRVAVLFNPLPSSPLERRWAQFEDVAAPLGLTVQAIPLLNMAELEKAVGVLRSDRNTGVIIIPDAVFNLARAGLITSLMNRNHIVAVYPSRDFVVAGGLASYSINFADLQYRAAGYVDRILKGTKPADLPVLPPAGFELVVNLRTARQLDVAVPAAVLDRATEVVGR